jgi:hypothetical protein
MAFGEPMQDATYVGSEGMATLRFDAADHGEICLPEEACKAIAPVNFGWAANATELLGEWAVIGTDNEVNAPFGAWLAFDQVEASPDPSVVNRGVGSLTLETDDQVYVLDLSCDRLAQPDPWPYTCAVQMDEETLYLGFAVSRNSLTGESYDMPAGPVASQFQGFRTTSGNGRQILPN